MRNFTILWYVIITYAGPFGSLLVKRIGCRKTAALGGFIMSSGLVLSAFMTSVLSLFLCLDVLAGRLTTTERYCLQSASIVLKYSFNKFI